MDKRGDDAINFIPFMFLIIVIAGAIAGGVYAFFGTGYDARQGEAESLFLAVQDCVQLKKAEVFLENFSFKECGLDENVLIEEHLILIERFENRKILGVFDYSNQCFFDAAKERNDLPRCVFGKVDGYDIIVATNQRGDKL